MVHIVIINPNNLPNIRSKLEYWQTLQLGFSSKISQAHNDIDHPKLGTNMDFVHQQLTRQKKHIHKIPSKTPEVVEKNRNTFHF